MNAYPFKRGSSVKVDSPPSEKESNLKEKNLAPMGFVQSFLSTTKSGPFRNSIVDLLSLMFTNTV